jgi:hypothetical protein
MDELILKTQTGGLDSDTDIQRVAPIDYIDAHNLTNTKKGNNERVDLELIGGNEYKFSLGSVEKQTKIFSFLITEAQEPQNLSLLAPVTTVQFYTQNGVPILPIELDIANGGGYTVADYASQIQAAIVAAGLTSATATSSVFTNNGYTYRIDIELNDTFLDYDNWYGESFKTNNLSVVFGTNILQEAITPQMEGDFAPIGAFNLNRDLFIWSTPKETNYAREYPITLATNGGSIDPIGYIRTGIAIGTNDIQSGDEVIISGFDSTTGGEGLNGVWIVDIGTGSLLLAGSGFQTISLPTSYNSNTVVKKNIVGVGQVSHAIKNFDGSWTHTKLIASRALGLFQDFRVDSFVKTNSYYTILSWTDNNQTPKLLNYVGEYIENGFLINDNPLGLYDYGSLEDSSKMLIGDSGLSVSVIQSDTGGALTTGSYVYFVRGVGADFSKSEFSFPSNPMPVFTASSFNVDETLLFEGSLDSAASEKLNTLTISNIPAGVYKYIEIAFVKYFDNSFSFRLIEQVPIGNSDTSLTYQHVDNSSVTALATTDLFAIYIYIKKALNLQEIDNRLVLSNVELQKDYNITSFAQAITFTVKRKELQKEGLLADGVPLLYGSYQLPINANKYPSLMLFETYRIGVKVKWKKANWSKVYWCFDAKIDTSNGLTDYSLASLTAVYSFYLELSNINLDFVVDELGQSLRTLIEDIKFEVMPMKEVLMSGVAIMSDQTGGGVYRPQFDYTGGYTVPNISSKRGVMFLMSHEQSRQAAPLVSFQQGDRLINAGQASIEATYSTGDSGIELIGDFTSTVQDYELKDLASVYDSTYSIQNGTLDGGTINYETEDIAIANAAWNGLHCANLDANLFTKVTSNTDYGVYNYWYFRPMVTRPSLQDSVYYPRENPEININTVSASDTFDFFAGDCFTQKKYLKGRNKVGSANDSVILGFYSQNRENVQLQHNIFPAYSIFTGNVLSKFNDYKDLPQTERSYAAYTKAYNFRESITSFQPYNVNSREESKLNATVFWSLQGLENSQYAGNRYFLPANRKDLYLRNGSINAMVVANDLLITIQDTKTERQYFNNTNQLKTLDDNSVLLGTGEIMGTKGVFLSGYGTRNKYGVVMGVSEGGRDIFYVIDSLKRKIIRHGADGSVDLAGALRFDNGARKLMNNLREFYGQKWDYTIPRTADYTVVPYLGNVGVIGGWMQKNKEAYFTFISFLKYPSWDDITSYSGGSYVIGNSYGFANQFPLIYQAVQNSTGETPIDNPDYWEQVDINDTRFYNFHTLVYSEADNRFKWTITPKPFLWIKYEDTLLSPSPKDKNKISEHTEDGLEANFYCYTIQVGGTWTATSGSTIITSTATSLLTTIPVGEAYAKVYFTYQSNIYEVISYQLVGGFAQMTLLKPINVSFSIVNPEVKICNGEDGYIEQVVNETQGNPVKDIAIQFDTKITPFRVDFNNDVQKSYLYLSDRWKSLQGIFYSPIKNDSTNTGLNSGNTSALFGRYLKIKFTFQSAIAQKLHNFAVKVRFINRKRNK